MATTTRRFYRSVMVVLRRATVWVPATASHAAPNKLAPPSAVDKGEGVVKFTFFSRPLKRPQAASAAATTRTTPVESTMFVQAVMNRLQSMPLFFGQSMAWL
jgi:phytochrome-interacting factor 3